MDSKWTRSTVTGPTIKTSADYGNGGGLIPDRAYEPHAPETIRAWKNILRATGPSMDDDSSPHERALAALDLPGDLARAFAEDGSLDREVYSIESRLRADRPRPTAVPTEQQRFQAARAAMDAALGGSKP